MKVIKKHNIILIFLCLLVSACNSKQVYHEIVNLNDNQWFKDSIIQFSIDVKDTTSSYDITLSITNNDDYSYSNLYLFTNIIMPSRQYLRDTIEFMLSTPDGQWLGTGLNGYTNDFQYKTNVRFPQIGIYNFTFEQAMRCKNKDCCISGIKSISLSLNKK